MKNNIPFTIRILSIALVALMFCSSLFSIVNAQEDTLLNGSQVVEPGSIDNPASNSGSADIPVMDSGNIPPEALPQEPECICTTLCTETAINASCPKCKAEGGVALCAYIPAAEALLERCNKLSEWYDGIVAADHAAVNSKGVLRSEDDKTYFIDEYEAIARVADRMASEQRGQVTSSDIFMRLQKLYAEMSGGYIVQYFSNDAILQKDTGSVKNRMATPNKDEPSFQQECAPNTEYKYPDMDDAGLPEHPGYILEGWSDSPDGTEDLHQPGEPFKNLGDNAGATVRLYAVWEATSVLNVTLDKANSPNIKTDTNFGTGKATAGVEWTGKITVDVGYKLRENPISVTIDNTEIIDANISCDADGLIKIPAKLVTGDIVITAFTVPLSYNVTLLASPNVRDDGEHFGTNKAYYGQSWAGDLLMQGYHFDTDYNKALAIKVNNVAITGACVDEIIETTTVPSNTDFIYTVNGDIMIDKARITGNITIQAFAIANTYKVVYDKNAAGATGTMNPETRTYNTAVAPLPAIAYTYTGYSFLGWSRSPITGDVAYNNLQSVNNLTSTNNGTVTLYALWKATNGYPASLQNGSFEKPEIIGPMANVPLGYSSMKWLTTAPDKQIEIGNANYFTSKLDYNVRKAADGNQFAELNAGYVGALYQNVATMPGSTLSWGLSHKCRMKNGIVETMQVWIGSEDLVNKAIEQYKAAGNKVSGVDAATLAAVHQRTISSSYIDAVTWNNYTGTYVVPSGQAVTMFAFVSVSEIQSSMGNLLDNVYFGATPPKPKTEITVATTQGGSVTVTYAGNPVSTLNSANPSYTSKLDNGEILKLYSNASSGYAYNGAFLNGVYTPKAKIGSLSWEVGNTTAPTNISVLYSKLRTLSFSPMGGAYTPLEETLGNNTTIHTVKAPSRPGFRFDGWKVVCPDLKPEQIANPPVTMAGDTINYVTKNGVTSLEIKRGPSVILTIPGERGVNLVATYSPQYSTLTVNPNGGRYEGTANPTASLTANLSLLNTNWTLTAPTREGYDFAGWTSTSTNAKLHPNNSSLIYSIEGTNPKLKIGSDAPIAAPPSITFTAQWESRDATQPTITAGTPASITMVYGDASKVLTVATSAVPEKHTYSYQWYKNTANSNSGGTAVSGATAATYSIPAKTEVGRSYYYCVVTATRTNTSLSKSATSNAATVTVTPRPVTLNWSTNKYSYDGTAKTVNAVVNNALAGDTVAVTSYTNNTKTAAGSYTAVAAALGNSNYMLPASPNDRQNWSIDKKIPVLVPQVDTMKFTDETATSKHNELSFKYSYDGDGVVSASSDRADIIAVTINTTTQTVVVRIKDAKPSLNSQITITLTATEGANYNAVTSVPVLLNIQQGQLIGGADGYVGIYDGLPHGIIVKPMLDYPSEIFYGTSASNCTSPSSPTYINVGTYEVFYEIKIKPIANLLPSGLTIKGSKFATITPAPLTASYVSEAITFGAVPVLKVEVTGFKNGQTAAGLTGFITPTVSNSNKLPGVYTLTPAGGTATANYAFNQYNSGTLTIGAASMEGQVNANSYTGVYNGLGHSITVNSLAGATVKYGTSADKCTSDTPLSYKDVGVYTEYYVVSRPGFNDVKGSAKVTITKAQLTATLKNESITYGTPAELEVVVTGFVAGDNAANASGYIAPTVINNEVLPKVYRLTPQGGYADNYSFNYASGTLLITAKTITPEPNAADVSKVYDNQFHGIEFTNLPGATAADPEGTATITYGTTSSNVTLNTMPTYQNVGSYTIYYRISLTGHEDATGSARVNITQRPISVKSVKVDDKVYDGTTAVNNPVITLEPAGANRGLLTGDTLTATATAVFNSKDVVGNKTVSVSGIKLEGGDAPNYNLEATSIAESPTTAKITAKPVTFAWYYGVGGTVNRVYDGNPSNVYAYVTGGLVKGDVCNITTTGGNEINVGNHTAKATGVTNTNYKLPTGTVLTQVYTNTKATLNAKCANQTITYNPLNPGTPPTIFKIEVTGFVNGENPDNARGYTAPTSVLEPEWHGAGDYKLKASGGSADNYTFTYQDGDLKVTEGALQATVTNYLGDYDGKPHGISVAALAGLAEPTITYYTDDTYTVETSTSTYTDVPDPNANPYFTVYYKLTAPSCTDVKGIAYVQINPKQITAELNPITATPTKVYDGKTDASSNVTVTLNGLVAGQTPEIVAKIDYASANVGMNKVVNLTELKLNDKGAYKARNYVLSNNPVSARIPEVGITEKPVTLIWSGNNTAATYTGLPRSVTATVAGGALVNGDACAVIVVGGTEKDAGTHTATATGLTNNNYMISAAATTTYTTDKAELVAQYVSEELAYGTNPAFQIEVTGFINGENQKSAADYVAPTVSPPAGSTETPIPVGTHTLTPAGGGAKNYTFAERKEGTLKIIGLNFNDQVFATGYIGEYDGSPHGITVLAPAGATITYYKDVYKNQPFENGTEKITDANPHKPLAVYYRVEMANHVPVEDVRFVTIQPQLLTATVENVKPKGASESSIVYNGSDEATGNIVLRNRTNVDVSAGNAVTATGKIRFTNANAGSFKLVNVTDIVIQNNAAGNYALKADQLFNVPTGVNIEQKEIRLDWKVPTAEELVYDGTVKNVTATVNAADLISGDVCTVTVANGEQTNAGSYTATATKLSSNNYKLPEKTEQPFTIAKAALTEDNFIVIGYKGLYDRTLHNAVTLFDTEDGDTIRYSIVNNPEDKVTDTTNWMTKTPKIGKRNSKLNVIVQVERPNHEVFTSAAVQAVVWNAPEITFEAPQFYRDNPRKVTVVGNATNPTNDKYIESVDLQYCKEGDRRHIPLKHQETEDNDNLTNLGIEYTFENLEPDTLYEVVLASRNWMEEGEEELPAAEGILHFRTNPLVPDKGTISGKVLRTTTSTSQIDVTLESSGRVMASQKNVKSGETFTFTDIADGEYNLVAADAKYRITQFVTVENGKAVQQNIIINISPMQTVVVSDLNAAPVTAAGMEKMFESAEINNNAKVAIALQHNGIVKLKLAIDQNQYEWNEVVRDTAGKLGVTLDVTLSMIVGRVEK